MWPARLGELVTCFILFSMFLLCFLTCYLFLDTFLTRRIRSYDVTRSPRSTKITRKRTIVVNTIFSTQAFCFTNHACPEDYLAKSSPDGCVIKIGQEWFEAPECSNHISSTLTNPVLPVSNLVLTFQHNAEHHPTDILFSTFSPLGWTLEQNCANTLSSGGSSTYHGLLLFTPWIPSALLHGYVLRTRPSCVISADITLQGVFLTASVSASGHSLSTSTNLRIARALTGRLLILASTSTVSSWVTRPGARPFLRTMMGSTALVQLAHVRTNTTTNTISGASMASSHTADLLAYSHPFVRPECAWRAWFNFSSSL